MNMDKTTSFIPKATVPTLILVFIQCLLFTNTACSQDTKPIHLPFIMTEDGHTLIKATINGVEGNFIFDTGAGLNLLTKTFVDSIGNLEKTDGFYTAFRATGEKVQVDLWRAGHVEIGAYELEKEIFSVYDIDIPLAGLISLTAFKNAPITIDYEDKVLVVESDESVEKRIKKSKAVIPVQISKEQGKTLGISTSVLLDNKLTLHVKLDSGAGFDVYRFNARYMAPLGIDSTQVEHEYKQSIFKPKEGNDYYYTKIPEMSTLNGEIETGDLNATFIDGLIYEGIMGINWLGDKITIDILNERLIIN
ncbi:MAG: hypothetical protein FH748_05080 [Balneolaceae bacterium]|nr:hypothetical protein [Balneolaceae bacterium]